MLIIRREKKRTNEENETFAARTSLSVAMATDVISSEIVLERSYNSEIEHISGFINQMWRLATWLDEFERYQSIIESKPSRHICRLTTSPAEGFQRSLSRLFNEWHFPKNELCWAKCQLHFGVLTSRIVMLSGVDRVDLRLRLDYLANGPLGCSRRHLFDNLLIATLPLVPFIDIWLQSNQSWMGLSKPFN